METAALPVEGKVPLDPDVGRRSRRSGHQPERFHESALAAMAAVSSYLDSDDDLPGFFARLGATIAELSHARRAAFWRLGPRGTLTLQPMPYGFAKDSPIFRMRHELGAAGLGEIERVVFEDQLDLVRGTAPALDAIWRKSGLGDVKNSIAAAWIAGERRIGAVVVYDSQNGFTANDLCVLRLAGMATGLVWQYKESEDELGHTAVRLEEAMSARRHLLNNIAAGGDEALTHLTKLGDRIDLILLDLSLPGRNGIEILREIRFRGYTLPIIKSLANLHPNKPPKRSKVAPMIFFQSRSGSTTCTRRF